MSKFQGIIVPMVTPFKRDKSQSINYEAAEQLTEKLIASGVSGLFVFGSNGEFHVCSPEEKTAYTKFIVNQVDGRVPVYMGTGGCSTYEATELSKHAEAIGCDAVSVINPYFMAISDAELVAYYTAIAQSVQIPVMLYNIPKSTGTNISSRVVAELAPIDNIQGIKDSSGNMDNLLAYVKAAKGNNMDVLVGSDGNISAGYACGASGAVAGTANLITDVVVGLWQALEAGDVKQAEELQADIEPIRDIIHLGSTPQTLKRSLELSGIPVGPARLPVAEVAENVDEKIIEMLDHYGIVHR